MRILIFSLCFGLLCCATAPSYKYYYHAADTKIAITLSRDIKKQLADKIINAVESTLKENEFIYSIHSYKDEFTVLTTHGIPKPNQMGIGGNSYRVSKQNQSWVIEFGGIWIT